jgi:hypothetical protein
MPSGAKKRARAKSASDCPETRWTTRDMRKKPVLLYRNCEPGGKLKPRCLTRAARASRSVVWSRSSHPSYIMRSM